MLFVLYLTVYFKCHCVTVVFLKIESGFKLGLASRSSYIKLSSMFLRDQ